VAAQVNSANEGASGDLFIAVTIPDPFIPGAWVTTNMLLIDEGQLGLMPHDDLDAVIVWLGIAPDDLWWRIEEASVNYDPEAGSDGYGFTDPLVHGEGEAAVGFSVDTASIGLMFTAVDFECRVDGMGLPGAVPPASGLMEQAGDIFYADLVSIPGSGFDLGTGIQFATNYLWFEENAIGLDPGAWTFIAPGPSGNLGDLPDELNALDSWKSPTGPICFPDLDWDGDVDGTDFLTFINCFNGSLNPPAPGCMNLNADMDSDGDVDGTDFLTWVTCFNGSLQPPAPGCICTGGS
jgi:hypothetical protein